MSMMKEATVTCPSCQEQIEVTVAESVNADRRPDLREAIIDGTFQVVQCSKCDAEFMLDPQLNYLDAGRGQWIATQSLDRLGRWVELEDSARDLYDVAYGAKASPEARSIGDELSPRLVFGWAAMREKLLIGDLELDDTTVELAKLAMIRGLPGAPLRAGVDLRLVDVSEDGDLVFNWTESGTGDVIETLIAPRSLYGSIIESGEAWAEMRAALEDGLFVDVQKLWIGEGRAAG